MSKKGYCGCGEKLPIEGSFAERLDQLMQEHDENCCDVAKIVGVERKTVYAWFDNKQNVKAIYAIKLADHYEVSLDWLCGRKNYNREGMMI